MGSFHDVRLPEDIERGATGGPRFRTEVVILSDGSEKRNITWSQEKGRWNIGYGIQDAEGFFAVLEFYKVRFGSAYSFRFRDWSDYTIGDATVPTPQSIGLGDGSKTVFSIYKTYVSGLNSYNRNIEKPVSGTVIVYLDSVETGSGFTIDHDLGEITFTTPPALNVDVGITALYDVPVRFSEDEFNITLEQVNAGTIPDFPIEQVRGEIV